MMFYTCYCLFVILVAVSASSLVPTSRLNEKEKMRLVVNVEGKSFYAETTPLRNREDAKTHCESMGMKLASITSSDQHLALKNSYHKTNFHGEFWTSAKTADGLQQFGWNDGCDAQPGNFILYGGHREITYNGLTIKVQSSKVEFFANALTESFGTLCEKS